MPDKWSKKITASLRYLALVALVAAVVAMLDLVPSMVDSGNMRRYSSMESLRGAPGMKEVLVPSYFPEGITWPPSIMLGQREPFSATVLGFDGTIGSSTVSNMLVISQSSSDFFGLGSMSAFEETRQSVDMDIKGQSARLETGLCYGGQQCSRLRWRQAGQSLELFMRSTSVELIRIAESMLK